MHRKGDVDANVESHLSNMSFRVSTCGEHSPSERIYCVPLCSKHDNFPCNELVAVVLTDEVAVEVIDDVAVVVAVVAVGLVVTVDVAVVVIVENSQPVYRPP